MVRVSARGKTVHLQSPKRRESTVVTKITAEILSHDAALLEYFARATFTASRRGDGVFVGNYEIAPEKLRAYGIVLPNGGMIIPNANPDELRAVVQEMRDAELAEYRRAEAEAETVRNEAERQIAEARSRLIPQVLQAVDLLEKNAGPGWKLQALEYGKDESSHLYHVGRIREFEASHAVGLLELSPVTDRPLVFAWSEDDIGRLTETVERWVKATEMRRAHIWRLFVGAQGVFTSTTREMSCFAGHSLASGKARYDEWVEVTHYVAGVEVTDLEHEWLVSRSDEIPIPKGYVRVGNGLNELIRIPPMPGRNDHLVVVGKTGSRRGVWSYGVWFSGHPSTCDINFYNSKTQREIQSVTLNGVVQPSKAVDLSRWKNPSCVAWRALHEAGVKDPPQAHVEAVAKAYRQ